MSGIHFWPVSFHLNIALFIYVGLVIVNSNVDASKLQGNSQTKKIQKLSKKEYINFVLEEAIKKKHKSYIQLRHIRMLLIKFVEVFVEVKMRKIKKKEKHNNKNLGPER